ncbi:NUDIX hydrolase [Pseudokineococcus sp. 1T1Z-3]|uniref:NUDIX hydrolase n=1 Tax=Pseudokineococcus sp. 1T1Z-3 TaxID=3132745 RepID=UPI003095118D
MLDLGDLTGAAADAAGLARRLAAELDAALASGARRVQAVHAVADEAVAWVAARGGLRREGVLRGVACVGGEAPRDLAVVAWVAGDPLPAQDGLPALLPLLATSLLAAGLVLRDPAGRVLLLRTSYKVPWEVPGGLVEEGEGLRAAAAREVGEELGLGLVPGRLLALDRRSADGRQPGRLLALLDGGVHDVDLPVRCRFLDGEVLEAAWCTPAQVRERTGRGLAERVEAALRQLVSGDLAPAVLLDGVPEG